MKRPLDWECPTGQSVLISQFSEPQFKNRITLRDYSRNGSGESAQAMRKEIQRKTLNKLFDAQKQQKGDKCEAVITATPETPAAPPSGLRSILSYFPHSSRIPDCVNYSGVPTVNATAKNCSLCNTAIVQCVTCNSCGCENICSNCSFANYQESVTRYVCHKCYQ